MNHWFNITLHAIERLGKVEQSLGLKWTANGPPNTFVGEYCDILDANRKPIAQAEVIGFDRNKVFLMPYSDVKVQIGSTVRASGRAAHIPVGNALLGRVLNAFGNPIDDKGPLRCSEQWPLTRPLINPLERRPITERLTTGIHAIDALMPIGKGQRIGLFAGSGVGKSSLLGMMAQYIQSDINVIALIGERGREINDFISHHLNTETRNRSVLVVSLSDDHPLNRRQAVFTATTIAEYFCSMGNTVLLLMDSITRYAMAQREIGLSLGEPPTARGYTPTVFSTLPKIIERAGCFKAGSITALYTVLVEGDDFNEPIADTMRSLLDGHIVLTRSLAHRGHYPAIDVLQSVSRLAKNLTSAEEQQRSQHIIKMLSLYQRNKDLIELGAYQPGNHPQLDEAVNRIDAIEALLTQTQTQSLSHGTLHQRLKEILS
jgi:flagellum-specific ATP synthase